MATVADLITRSMKLANILGEGQTPSAEQASGALDTLNEMISAWNLDSLILYSTDNDSASLVAGQSVYTIGTGGDFNINRPAQINSMYQVYQDVTYPIYPVTQDEYNLITLKTLTNPLVKHFLYVNSYPLGKLTFWPVPTLSNTISISVDRVLSSFSTLATTISMPPGYAKALRANLAVELCPEYGREPSPALAKAAASSKADIKRGNWTPTVSEYDVALTRVPGGYASFISGW